MSFEQQIKERIAEINHRIDSLEDVKFNTIDSFRIKKLEYEISELKKLKEISENLYYKMRGLQ